MAQISLKTWYCITDTTKYNKSNSQIVFNFKNYKKLNNKTGNTKESNGEKKTKSNTYLCNFITILKVILN